MFTNIHIDKITQQKASYLYEKRRTKRTNGMY